MTLLIIIFCIWGASALIRASREAKRQSEIDRQRREQAARSAELARMTAEWKQRQAEAKAETARLIALEREQMKQAREQERLAKEQERQAAQLAKHEERLLRLEQKLELAKRDEKRYSELFDRYDIELAGEQAALNYIKSNPLLKSQAEKQQCTVDKLSKQRYDAETKLIKARQAREFCEKQMEAA